MHSLLAFTTELTERVEAVAASDANNEYKGICQSHCRRCPHRDPDEKGAFDVPLYLLTNDSVAIIDLFLVH